MARYNRWQNAELLAITDALDDAARKAPQGLFFNSIHNTLDHILMVDSRLAALVESGAPPDAPFAPERLVYDDYAELAQARAALDRHLVALADDHGDAWYEDEFMLVSPVSGQARSLPRHFYLVQLFNHATHHRSQVTTVLHKLGHDYGTTDLPMNPDTIYAR